MAQNTVPIAKITGPRLVKGVITRNWLFKRIDQSRSAQAVWVAGPGGSGKTTLMSSYLEERNIPALWYHLDEGDSDIATFFHYMGLAAKEATPDAKPLPLLTPEYTNSLSTFTKRYFENLFERMEKPAVLVLDNYQEVPGESKFHNVIRECLPVVPDKVTVFILSRTEPPPEMSRAVARRFMEVIGWKELRFTLDETHALVRLIGQKKYTSEAVHQLHRKTDGWVAGILLLLRQASLEEIDPAFLAKHTPEEVFQYFAKELFDKTDPEIQSFLLSTAILPQMTPKMAEALSGISRAENILANMRRNHLFTSRRLGEEAVYEYHPLYREFLLARGRNLYSAERLADLSSKAAGLLEKDGQVEAAMSLYHSSADVGNMVRLILNQAQTLIFQCRHLTLQQWLGRLPDELVDQEPWLLYWLASCKVPVDPVEGRDVFKKALSVSQEQDDSSGTLHALCSLIESVTNEFESFTDVDQWVPKLHAIYKEIGRFSSADIEARVTSSFLYSFAFRQPESQEYKTWREKAIDILEEGETIGVDTAMRLISPIVLHGIFSGELSEAEFILNKYRRLIETEDAGPFAATSLCNLDAYCAWLGGKLEKCVEIVEIGLKTSAATGVHAFSTYLAGHGASAALSVGNLQLAREYLSKMETFLGHARSWGRGYFHFLSNWQALIEKDPRKAEIHSRQALESQEKMGSMQTLAIPMLGRSLALNLLEDKAAAHDCLEKAFDTSRLAKTLIIEFGCHLARAEFALEVGDEATTLDALRKAMELGRKHGYVNIYYWRPRVIARLCEKALNAGIEVDYVRNLIRKRTLIPDEPPLETDSWPWPIRIFTLGRFGLEIDGVPFPGKIQQTPLSLLKALIAFGGMNVAEASLQDALWPDADGDAAANAFSTTLHRLRKMLQYEKVVRLDGGKVSLDDRICWVDARLLEKRMKDMGNALEDCRSGEPWAKVESMMKEAVRLSPGLFLPEETAPWAIARRQQLKESIFRCLQRLVRHHAESEEMEKAVHWCNKGLSIDPCNEYFYQQLMHLYAAKGLRSQVIAAYHRCCGNLAAEYGVEPSDETKGVFRKTKGD